MSKQITLLIKQMVGGGAERVISLLCNALAEQGFKTTLIITHQKICNADLSGLNHNTKVISLEDEVKKESKAIKRLLMLKVRLFGKVNRLFFKNGDEQYLINKYEVRNYDKVKWLKRRFSKNEKNIIIAFLNDSIFLSLLSAKQGDKVIISERSDPRQFSLSKTNLAFYKKKYSKADIIFQSNEVKQWYKENFNILGVVIFNPINPNLPDRLSGKQKNIIVNFCRISPEKNLQLLIHAFELFHMCFNDYDLYIYGDAIGESRKEYLDQITRDIEQCDCKGSIKILPAQKDIHNLIKDYAMFVSSSDFEGMSNSMLEAMAIGLPTICTDCPAGGARAIIKDHENGILVPVNDAEAMCKAMCEVADNPELAEKLSINGTKLKEDLAVDKIVNQWMEIING